MIKNTIRIPYTPEGIRNNLYDKPMLCLRYEQGDSAWVWFHSDQQTLDLKKINDVDKFGRSMGVRFQITNNGFKRNITYTPFFLKNERMKARMFQPELADILGLDFATISIYERGKGKPTINIMKKLSLIFKVDFRT